MFVTTNGLGPRRINFTFISRQTTNFRPVLRLLKEV